MFGGFLSLQLAESFIGDRRTSPEITEAKNPGTNNATMNTNPRSYYILTF